MLDLKLLYDEIQIVLSTINRNLENLNEYYGYKEFLDSISSKEFQEKQQRKREEKRRVKAARSRSKLETTSSKQVPRSNAGRKADKKKDEGGADDFEAENELHISAQLRELLDDSEDELEQEFSTPDDLLANFTDLEEKNLFLI